MAVQLVPLAVKPKPITYEEYRALPEDGMRYEVIEGELYMTAAPVINHQRVIISLVILLERYAREHSWGEVLIAPVELYLDKKNFVEPDIVAISQAHQSIIQEKNIKGVPDLVVEVLSPSTARIDRVRKAKLYAKHRVPHYWIVDFDAKTLQAYEWDKASYRLAATLEDKEIFEPSLFPGLKIPLSELWR